MKRRIETSTAHSGARVACITVYCVFATSCGGDEPATLVAEASGLEWQRVVAAGLMYQPDAVAYCDSLVLAGASDWRLPSLPEMRSLLDPARMDPAYADARFPNIQDNFWTSTLGAGGTTYAWLVSTWDGTDGTALRMAVGLQHAVRCVRGTPLPTSSTFTDVGDGTTSDPRTGLVWEQIVGATPVSFADATAHCAGLVLGNASPRPWRLPTLDELESIADYARRAPAIDQTYFGPTPTIQFWTSTPYPDGTDQLRIVEFNEGSAKRAGASGPAVVRCVR